MDMAKILIITGDGGEAYEALYAVHRFEEEGWHAAVAAPSRRRLNLVMHDFEPGWDTYIERPGYGLEAGLTFDDVNVADYAAVLVLGGRAPEYLRNNTKVMEILREFDRQEKWILSICHGVQVLAADRTGARQARDLLRARSLGSGARRGNLRERANRAGRTHDHCANLAIAPSLLSRDLRTHFGQGERRLI